MADAFQGLNGGPATPFANLQTDQVNTATNPQATDKTARIAGLALADPKSGDLISEIQKTTDVARQTLQTAGDTSLRLQAAGNQQLRELQSYNDLYNQPKEHFDFNVATGIENAFATAMGQHVEERAKSALESEAVNRIQDLAATGDSTQARLLLNNLENGDYNHIIRDMNTKQLILDREVSKLKDETGGDWIGHAANFILSMAPVYKSGAEQGNVNVPEGLKGFGDWFWSGRRMTNESSALWSMPANQFADFVPELLNNIKKHSSLFGFEDKDKELSILSQLNRPEGVITHNAWGTLDNLGFLGPAEAKGIVSIPGTLIRNGARKEATNLVTQAAMDIMTKGADVAAATTGLTTEEVVDHTLPSIVNPKTVYSGETATQGVASKVSLAGDVNQSIAQVKTGVEEFTKLQQLGRMTDAETQDAVAATIKKISEQYEDVGVHDISPSSQTLSDSTKVHSVQFTVGTFESDAKASEYAKSIGYDGAEIVTDHSGIKSVRLEAPVTETGMYTQVLNPAASGMLARVTLQSRAIGDRLLGDMAQSAGNTRAKLLNVLAKDYAKTISILPQFQKEALSQVLASGENLGKWFTRDEREALWERAYNRPPTTGEHAAYEVAQHLNDIEWRLRNDEIYKTKFIQGYQNVSFDTGLGKVQGRNGRVIENWEAVVNDRVFNSTDQVHYNKSNPLTQDVIDRLKAEGYVLTNMDKPVELSDGTLVKSILAKKGDLKIEPLRRDQLAYRAGGHRIYSGKYFAKQAVVGVQPDGEKFFKNPGTYIVGKTKAEVDYWTERMEAARKAYLSGSSASDLESILPPYMKGEEFVKNMESGVFQKDTPFRTMYDREQMPEYAQTSGFNDLRDTEESNIESYMRTNGRLYYSGKGEVLKDWQGSQAPTLDPFKTINQSIINVANLSSMSDYKLSATERWMKTFGSYLQHTPTSPMDALRSGVMRLDTPEFIRQQAEAQRDVIKRTLGWRTEWDRQKEIYGRRMAEWIGGTDPYSIRDKATAGISTWWNTNNPIQALRGVAFDLKLGLMNIAQFPMQIQTMVAATTLHPEYGFKGMVTMIPMLYGYMTKSGTEHMLDTFVERGLHETGGFSSKEEFKHFMRTAKDSGFFDIGGTHLLINDYGPNAAAGILSKDGIARQAGRFWFNEGERWNRAVAWRIAWGETADKMGAGSFKTNDFLRAVNGRAEDYAFGMSEQSAAYWQKGLLSIPTQFWAYNARMLEAMLGKTFTPQQRMRLIIGQTLLYGSAGIPVAPFISEQIKKHNGKAPDINSLGGFVDRGLLDTTLYHMTGQDVQLSKRFGTGAFWTDTIKDMFGFSSYGEKSFADIVGGAGASIGQSGFETLGDVIKYATAESGGEMPLTEDAFMRLANNISIVSNLHKAWLVHQYGTLVSNKGTTMVSGLPSSDAWAVALGFQPGETDQVASMMGYLKDNKTSVDEAVKVISGYRSRMINEPDNRVDINAEINAYTKLLPPEVRLQALQKSQNYLSPSLMDSISTQVMRDKVRADTLKEMENADGGSNNNP